MIRVLLVHEVRLMGAVLAALLEKEADLQVIGLATTLEEALAQAADGAVVLLQATEPPATALQWMRALRQAQPAAKLVVFGLAGAEGVILLYLEAGAAGYVPAESSPADLLSTLRAVWAGTAQLPAEIVPALMARVTELAALCQATGAPPFPPAPALPELTPRERAVLDLIAQGLRNAEIAERLSVELGTVKNHVHNLLKKLNVSCRDEAAAYWVRLSAEPPAPGGPVSSEGR